MPPARRPLMRGCVEPQAAATLFTRFTIPKSPCRRPRSRTPGRQIGHCARLSTKREHCQAGFSRAGCKFGEPYSRRSASAGTTFSVCFGEASMRQYVFRALAYSMILLSSVAANADDLPLEKLKTQTVDWLSFGITSLEAHLRLRQLEACARTDCRSKDVSISVSYVAAKSASPATLPWPAGGAIVISILTIRSGSDSSWATESGCRRSLRNRVASDNVSGISYAQFFIPRGRWIDLSGASKDPATMERVADISRRIVLWIVELHWSYANGRLDLSRVPDRTVTVTCTARLIDLEKIVIIGKIQTPK